MSSKIMVLLDGSERARGALPWILPWAREGELVLATVPEPVLTRFSGLIPAVEELAQALNDQHSRALDKLAADLRELGYRVRWRLGEGTVEEGIQALIAAERPDLVVLASHGRTGAERWLMGSVAEQLVLRCEAPVLVVPSHGRPRPFGTVLIPVDGTAWSERVLSRLPFRPERAHLLEVLRLPRLLGELEVPAEVARTEREQVEASLRELAARPELSGSEVTWEIGEGDPASVILHAARGADLIAMASQTRPRFLTGSVALKVARHAPCPVLLVPPGCRAEEPTGAGAAAPLSAERADRDLAAPPAGDCERSGCA